jgi:hypothetical protein
MSREKYIFSNWCAIEICGLHQLLEWSLEIPSECIWHLSASPLPFSTPKTARVLHAIHVIKKLKNLFSGRSRANLNLFSLERGDLNGKYSAYFGPVQSGTAFRGSTKVRILIFFQMFFYILSSNPVILKLCATAQYRAVRILKMCQKFSTQQWLYLIFGSFALVKK